MSALLRDITSKGHGGFLCLSCLQQKAIFYHFIIKELAKKF